MMTKDLQLLTTTKSDTTNSSIVQQCIAVRCIPLLGTAHWRWISIYTKYLDLGCLPSPARRLVQLGRRSLTFPIQTYDEWTVQ